MKRVVSFLSGSVVSRKCQTETCSFFCQENKFTGIHSCSTTAKIVEDDQEPSFRTLLFKRLQQARRSVAVEVPSQEELLKASTFIEESTNVKEIVHFTSKSKKDFIIAEFQDADAAQHFLSEARSVVRNNEIPNFSRIVSYFDASSNGGRSKEVLKINCSKLSVGIQQNFDIKDKTFSSLSEVVKDVYEEEKLTEVEYRLRFLICSQISDAFHGFFRQCEVLPFGSSVNGLGTHTSDLDAVLCFYAKKEQEGCGLYFQTKKLNSASYENDILDAVGDILNKFVTGITYVEPVYRARIPLVKFYHKPFEMDCDLSLSSVSGLEMSELLYTCGSLDSRVRPLAFAIKKWAKVSKVITDTGTHTITNFSLFLLLVYFLQTRPLPVLPPLCRVTGIKSDKENCRASLNGLRSAKCNQETLGDLLHKFFGFLRSFDYWKNGISPYHGKIIKKFENSPLIIENPLDKKINVSLNVTKNSLNNLIRAATVAQNHLEVLSKSTEIRNSHFWKSLSSQKHAEQ